MFTFEVIKNTIFYLIESTEIHSFLLYLTIDIYNFLFMKSH